MIKLIVGTKGSGKTKAMIDQINDAVKTSKGNVVVVEKGMKLTYDIAPAARLIDLDEYKISGGEMLYGFVAGLMASNYDITDYQLVWFDEFDGEDGTQPDAAKWRRDSRANPTWKRFIAQSEDGKAATGYIQEGQQPPDAIR